jgi:hydroxymethylbilane synthase
MRPNNPRNQTVEKGPVKIGTRGSALALCQAETVAGLLEIETELEIIKTSGDRFQNIPLQGQSQMGFFTKEIETRLLSGEVDLAVHSLKDLPTQPHEYLILGAYLKRAPVSDLLLIHPDWYDKKHLIPVKEDCEVGATSLRRQSLLRLYGPHTKPKMLRGNIPTRLQKCIEGQYGAIILARAGVERLQAKLEPLVVFELNPTIWLPAPGQGAIAIQVRRFHTELLEEIGKLDDKPTREAVTIERRLLANFEGGCHTAFGSYAQRSGENWDVYIGMEMPGKGWGQVLLNHRPKEELMEIGPTHMPFEGFNTIPVENSESLCTRIRL